MLFQNGNTNPPVRAKTRVETINVREVSLWCEPVAELEILNAWLHRHSKIRI